MIVVEMTGIAHGSIKQIEETICPRNLVEIRDEENQKASKGVAFAAFCKGVKIGYVPELDTLRGYYRAATSDEERMRIDLRGRATRALRGQLWTDMGLHGKVCTTGTIREILYSNDFEWKSSLDLPEEDRDKWTLRKVSVLFEDVCMW